jgi:hypothetical protein
MHQTVCGVDECLLVDDCSAETDEDFIRKGAFWRRKITCASLARRVKAGNVFGHLNIPRIMPHDNDSKVLRKSIIVDARKKYKHTEHEKSDTVREGICRWCIGLNHFYVLFIRKVLFEGIFTSCWKMCIS